MSWLPPQLFQRSSNSLGRRIFRRLLPSSMLAGVALLGLCACGDPVADGTAFESSDQAGGVGGSGSGSSDPTNQQGFDSAAVERNPNLPRIIILAADLGEPFRAVQASLIGDATDTAALNLDFLDAHADTKTQVEQLRAAIAERPAVIGIFPHTASDLISPLKEAAAAGVKVVILGQPPEGAEYAASLYTDQRQIGRVAGEFVLQRLRIKMDIEEQDEVFATMFEITGTPDDDRSRLRSEGFHEVFQDLPGLQLLHQAPGYWNEADAAKSMAEAVHIQGGVDVVFCHSDAMAYGAFLAGRKLGKHMNTLFMGIDGVGGPKGGITKVRDQMFAGTVSVPLLGQEIAELLSSVAQGAAPAQKDTVVAPELVTIANSSEMFEKHSPSRAGSPE